MYCISHKSDCCGSGNGNCATWKDNYLFWFALAAIAAMNLTKGKK